jgi:hypothetical protein
LLLDELPVSSYELLAAGSSKQGAGVATVLHAFTTCRNPNLVNP